jgi:hypothetical protein
LPQRLHLHPRRPAAARVAARTLRPVTSCYCLAPWGSPGRPVLLQLRPRGRAPGTPALAARRRTNLRQLLRVFRRVFEEMGRLCSSAARWQSTVRRLGVEMAPPPSLLPPEARACYPQRQQAPTVGMTAVVGGEPKLGGGIGSMVRRGEGRDGDREDMR